MKKIYLVILALLVFAIAGGVVFYWDNLRTAVSTPKEMSSATASPPATLVEDKSNLIRVKNIKPWDTVRDPLIVEGEARGYWFFEASFPVRVLDGNDKELTVGIAQAQDDPEPSPEASFGARWMTTEFVPFKTILAFPTPTTNTGTLVLQKDNPSGLPEYDDELRIPIRFDITVAKKQPCIVTGCSSQICSDEEVFTTCEYRAEYACYKTARCEHQLNGHCGWTQTSQLTECLAKFD